MFGSHKTFRGFFFGSIVGIIICYFQKISFMYSGFFRSISLVDYSAYNVILLGFLLGFGALLGDLIESMIKRQFGVHSGEAWIPWDQLDFVFGSLLLVSFVFVPPYSNILFLLISVPILHILTNHIGYYIGVNKTKW